jgi:hypothetical protein
MTRAGLGLAVLGLAMIVHQAASAQQQDALAALDAQADNCIYFTALNYLLDYNPANARQVIEAACAKQIEALDREGCRGEAGSNERAFADCVQQRAYSSISVNAAQNLMERIATRFAR